MNDQRLETLGEQIDRITERITEVMSERDAMQRVIVRLRKALAYYAKPDVGWDEIEHADAYEESRELVPDDPSEDES